MSAAGAGSAAIVAGAAGQVQWDWWRCFHLHHFTILIQSWYNADHSKRNLHQSIHEGNINLILTIKMIEHNLENMSDDIKLNKIEQ